MKLDLTTHCTICKQVGLCGPDAIY